MGSHFWKHYSNFICSVYGLSRNPGPDSGKLFLLEIYLLVTYARPVPSICFKTQATPTEGWDVGDGGPYVCVLSNLSRG